MYSKNLSQTHVEENIVLWFVSLSCEAKEGPVLKDPDTHPKIQFLLTVALAKEPELFLKPYNKKIKY